MLPGARAPRTIGERTARQAAVRTAPSVLPAPCMIVIASYDAVIDPCRCDCLILWVKPASSSQPKSCTGRYRGTGTHHSGDPRRDAIGGFFSGCTRLAAGGPPGNITTMAALARDRPRHRAALDRGSRVRALAIRKGVWPAHRRHLGPGRVSSVERAIAVRAARR